MLGECCNNEYFDYLVGEKCPIGGSIRSIVQGETVVINSARYEITKEYSDEVVSEGICDIDGDKFKAMISFSEEGKYVFKGYFKVGEAEPVAKAYINVSK